MGYRRKRRMSYTHTPDWVVWRYPQQYQVLFARSVFPIPAVAVIYFVKARLKWKGGQGSRRATSRLLKGDLFQVVECRSRPHRLEPLERIMVSVYLKWHSHEVRPELGYRPHDSQALQFGGGVGFLSLVEGSGSAADDALLAIADLSQDST